ncbi:hypothetical protein NDU88_009466 [Pleurodeles waltl]|uniref:Uncharacterized protein n=1 Tax=Pleurodeles waltl TaxID=8319 RepID=A0AAV7QVC8_PLEWA|nr:hypothetical protein NDU88_009466 [Pleurodeles waltl]
MAAKEPGYTPAARTDVIPRPTDRVYQQTRQVERGVPQGGCVKEGAKSGGLVELMRARLSEAVKLRPRTRREWQPTYRPDGDRREQL